MTNYRCVSPDQITWASDQIEIHILKDGGRIVTGYQGGLELM